MYAVFRTGGKQYRASEGDRLRVERLDAGVGDAIEFDQVLLVGEGSDVTVGSPLVAGGLVQAEVTAQGRGKKIDVVKFKRRTGYKRQHGHRQAFTELQITLIGGGNARTGKAKAKAKAAGADAQESAVEDGSATAE